MSRCWQGREYVKVQTKRLSPTESGMALNDFLAVHFPDLFAAPYTAHLEEALDTAARGETTRLDVLNTFWTNFTPQLGSAGQVAQARHPSPTPIDDACPVCGGELVERKSKHGAFIGCMNYPDCGYTRGLAHKPVTLHGASS